MKGLILLDNIPNLDEDYEPSSIDLNQEYWTPEKEGESIRGFFWGIESRKCLDQQSGKEIELDCVVLVVPDGDSHKSIANGSKRLVGVFESNGIQDQTPVEVTYKGKRKNRTNSNLSDVWTVITLKPKAQK